ncbi:MAG TPA: VOC family protein [Solirubrobacteraceae bacterium]|nr:VOC family protein [Solirubrobacteraceae bacterium]
MGERTGYPPGTFCWVELTTSDQAAAKDFYRDLFGWEADDRPVGDGAVYSMMQLRGRNVAAITEQPGQQRDAGVPPMWNSYVSVESADAAADRAAELGATVHAAPFDVLQAGRMAVIQDPQGAYFEIWEPREHFGAEVVNAPGAPTWNELASPDPAGSSSFYGGLFGWRTEPFEGADSPYLSIRNGDANAGGIHTLPAAGAPPGWLVYFGAQDVEQALGRLAELGGRAIDAPREIAVGRIAVAADPQGAVFALFAGDFDA